MKQYRDWKKLLMLALVLALTLTTPLRASEDVSKDTTGAEEEVIIDETLTTEAAPAENAAPPASISAPEPFINEIAEFPTGSVPKEANSGAEETRQGEPQANTKSIEFYLDWNGIDGLFGHCLTCTREYTEGTTPLFTAEDAAVYELNYRPEVKDELEGKSSDEKWRFLEDKWSKETINGYKFLGWSTVPTGGVLITSDTPIEEGMSFYAYWQKDDESNETFQRIDPAAEPLEAIRIVAGAGTEFRSGTLHAGKHAEADNSFTLDLFYTPVRATINDITWSVKVYEELSLPDVFRPEQKAKVITVKADGNEGTADGVTAKAEGCSLTITSTDNVEHVMTVSVTAKGADGQEFTSLSDATLSFSHSWDQGNVTKVADCVNKGSIHYTCTVCGATKDKDVPALEHVYNKNKNLNTDEKTYYRVITIKEPTCTEEGINDYICTCLRCGEEAAPERGKVPALGHAWSETVQMPASCNQDTTTRQCTRCNLQEVNLVPAYHPELHVWKETYRYHETCMSDFLYEKCEVCGETRSRTEAADNPDRHSYAYESSMRNDCYLVTYTFRCVHGCGATQVMLKKEEGHAWSGWTTTVSLDQTTGTMTRIRKRTCSRCGKEETEDLGSIPGQPETSAGNTPSTSQPSEPATENTAAPADEPAAPSSTGNTVTSVTAPAASSNTGNAAAPATAPAASSDIDNAAASVTTLAASSNTNSAAAAVTAPAASDTDNAAAAVTAPAASDTDNAAAAVTAPVASSDADNAAAAVTAPAASSGNGKAASATTASSNTGSAKKKTESKKAKITKPATTSFSYAKSGSKKKVTLKWKKSSGATGYQIQYSTNKKFSSGVVTKTVKGLKLTVSGLKSKKNYYFRIRAYKKSGKTSVYSSWSKVKKVTVK